MNDRTPAIIFDIDGTLALGIGKDRKAYDYDKVGKDKPNHMVWIALSLLCREYKIIFLSGRENVTFPGRSIRKDKVFRRAYFNPKNTDKWNNVEFPNCFNLTKAWLEYWSDIYDGPNDITLFMRAEGNNEPDHKVKKEMYYNHIVNDYNVKLVIDDRNQVVEMWRKLGLHCRQVAPGNF